MPTPRFRGNPDCRNHTNPAKDWNVRIGTYPTLAHGEVQRYRCRGGTMKPGQEERATRKYARWTPRPGTTKRAICLVVRELWNYPQAVLRPEVTDHREDRALEHRPGVAEQASDTAGAPAEGSDRNDGEDTEVRPERPLGRVVPARRGPREVKRLGGTEAGDHRLIYSGLCIL